MMVCYFCCCGDVEECEQVICGFHSHCTVDNINIIYMCTPSLHMRFVLELH